MLLHCEHCELPSSTNPSLAAWRASLPLPAHITSLTLCSASMRRPFWEAVDAIWINYTWKSGTPAAVRKEVRVGMRRLGVRLLPCKLFCLPGDMLCG